MLAEMSVPVIVSRWVHLVAVIVAVGGIFFLRVVLHPAASKTLAPDAHDALRPAVIRRWARVVHTCIALIILSGLYNAVVQFPQHAGQPMYHGIFGLKMVLALVLFFNAIALTGRSPAFASMRQRSSTWMAVNIALAAVIVLISNLLKNLPTTG